MSEVWQVYEVKDVRTSSRHLRRVAQSLSETQEQLLA